MAAVRPKTYRSSLKAMVSSPVCDEEENSDLDSSCSTLSVDESENSPPQSQVTPVMLKRTTSTGFTRSVVAMDQREDVEDPRGKFPPKQFCFLTSSARFLVSFVLAFFFHTGMFSVSRSGQKRYLMMKA